MVKGRNLKLLFDRKFNELYEKYNNDEGGYIGCAGVQIKKGEDFTIIIEDYCYEMERITTKEIKSYEINKRRIAYLFIYAENYIEFIFENRRLEALLTMEVFLEDYEV